MFTIEHAEEWLELAVSGRGIRKRISPAYQPTLPELFQRRDDWFIRFFYYRSELSEQSFRVEMLPRYVLVYSFFKAEAISFQELHDGTIVSANTQEFLTPAFVRYQKEYMECLEGMLDLLVLSGLEDGPAPPGQEALDELFLQWLDAQPQVLRSSLLSLAGSAHSRSITEAAQTILPHRRTQSPDEP